jgi:endonuclease III
MTANAADFYKRAVEGELFQEQLCKHPFWMLVACSLVNQTSWKQAEPIFAEMLRKSKGDERWLLRVDPDYLEEMLEPLGLHRRRAAYLSELPVKWFQINPETRFDVMDIPGFGTYASDSWAIFVEGDLSVNPTDKDLKAYLARRAKEAAEDEENQAKVA